MKNFDATEVMTAVLAFILLIVFFSALFAIITMWAWNQSLAQIFSSVPHIGFWQAFFLNMLSGMMFKSMSTK